MELQSVLQRLPRYGSLFHSGGAVQNKWTLSAGDRLLQVNAHGL
jgi:hypothetical protein